VSVAVAYNQCRLQKGNVIQTSWLPREFAVAGRYVKLKEEGGLWDDGWQVTDAYLKSIRTQEEVVDRSQDYKRTRKASDI
jgi:hypothetical protein